jgi:uncharacterized protein YjbI with pentapeptide repeats
VADDETEKFDFKGKTLSDCNFADVTVTQLANFRGATFTKEADFRGVTFTERADFSDATFTERADFRGATFTERAEFLDATFTKLADFRGATFTEDADFRRVTFTEQCNFGDATFTDWVNFTGATFTDWANFRGATFTKEATFSGVTFTERADFSDATFLIADFRGATFSWLAIFVNADMKGPTSFVRATFSAEPPQFFGAKLHEGTFWRSVTWPATPSSPGRAGRFIAAYERLKLEMDRLKKHEDELDFFARELQCRRVVQGTWRGLPIAIYGALCDYGRSYIRPLSILLVTVLVGAVPFWQHFGGVTFSPLAYAGHAREALGLSIANTFGVLGIRKDLIDPETIKLLPDWLKVIATVQTGLGIVLLFLFGLGIRNRFRMK